MSFSAGGELIIGPFFPVWPLAFVPGICGGFHYYTEVHIFQCYIMIAEWYFCGLFSF